LQSGSGRARRMFARSAAPLDTPSAISSIDHRHKRDVKWGSTFGDTCDAPYPRGNRGTLRRVVTIHGGSQARERELESPYGRTADLARGVAGLPTAPIGPPLALAYPLNG
jgi:hypothetical protein